MEDPMKRYIALLMAAAVTFSLAACGSEKGDVADWLDEIGY